MGEIINLYNITSYGAITGGICTGAVQKAIEDCSKAGGGIVYFPRGSWVLSTVFLRDNVKIVLADGCTVLGAEELQRYEKDEDVDYPLYQDISHSFFHCAMFVGIGCENVSIEGEGTIDMRSVWDEGNERNMVHRGAKVITFKNCKNVKVSGLTVLNATDVAIYFAGCDGVVCTAMKLRVYIDGISPDCCKNVEISDSCIESGDDGIVLKSSYTLNRRQACSDVVVRNCVIKSRCNALKFGTESNGGFKNIKIENIVIYNTRITGISIESVDGGDIENVYVGNITMKNVATPIFVHLGERLRGPEGTLLGTIDNITFENITADGPYIPYDTIEWNYASFVAGDRWQCPWLMGVLEDFDDRQSGITEKDVWQITSNICGLPHRKLTNIRLKDINFRLDGGAAEAVSEKVADGSCGYPEVYVYGRILPAKGIYFRNIDGLSLENVKISTYRDDVRSEFVFDSVDGLEVR